MLFSMVLGLNVSVYAQDAVTVYSDFKNANAGGQIRVPISIKNNKDILGWKLVFEYDKDILTPVSIENGDVFVGGLQDNIKGDMVPGKFNVYWASSDGEGKNYNGVMIYLVFEVSASAVGNARIDISYSQEDTFDNSYNDVRLECKPIDFFIANSEYSKYAKINASAEDTIAGNDVRLKLNISEISGVTELQTTVNYNADNFEFKVIDAANGLDVKKTETNGKLVLDISGITMSVNNTVFVTLTFKAKDKAVSGSYNFAVSSENQGIVCKGCSLKIIPSETSEIAELYVNDVSASYNNEITVPIYIENNHGIMGYSLEFTYDPALLQPISASCGEAFLTNNVRFSDSIGVNEGKFIVLWNNTDEIYANGILCTLTFKVLTEKKTDTSVIVNYSQRDTFNEKYEDVIFNCKDISFLLNPLEPNLSDFMIKAVSLSLQNNIQMNYKVLKTAVADFENPYMVFDCEGFNTTTVTKYTEQGDYYVFSFEGISPKMMNNEVSATLRATYKANGKMYSSSARKMSIKMYAYAMLDAYATINTEAGQKFRTLLVDLLDYGAKAQIYTNYKTDALVDAGLTAEQKAWGTAKTPELVSIADIKYKTIDNPTAEWKAVGLYLINSVQVRSKFAITNIEKVSVKVVFCGRTYTYTKNDFVANGDGTYYVYFDKILAHQMGEEMLVTVYDNGEPCSNTMRYSVESYAKDVQGSAYAGTALDNMLQAMMRYGQSANAYGKAL